MNAGLYDFSCSIQELYHRLGYSIIPLRLDGSKAPALNSWEPYKDRQPELSQINEWFRRPAGIGLICGVASQGLEVIDFDCGDLFWPWFAKVEGIVNKLAVIETPRSETGFHVLYRCSEVCGNQKIAMDNNGDTLIESRGQGGYVVGIGSPEDTHANRFPYIQTMGPLFPDSLAVITPDERKMLWQAAREFSHIDERSDLVNREVERRRRASRPEHNRDGKLTPWDDFNQRADGVDILTKHGWKEIRKEHWVRPGKRAGASATLRPTQDGTTFVLTNFSANAGIPMGKHSLFAVYAHLEHGGDFSQAASTLRNQGYGVQ